MKRHSVLLIEDDKGEQILFLRYVKKNNVPYDYTIASSVAEAKTVLDSKRFDVILSDYLLGDGTAFDIFDLKIDAPIIVVTGSGDEAVAAKAMKAGAYDYLIKDPDANYLKVLPSTVDHVIERKKANEKLKQYQLMVESAYDAIFFKDLNSRYIIANEKTSELFGLSREEVLGKTDYELIANKEEATKNVENDQAVFKTGKSKEIIKHMTDAEGKEYWFQTIKVPHFDTAGNITGLIGIARDITAHKRAEDQLKASLKEKEVLMQEVHHRVKNNLQVVSSMLNMQARVAKDKDASAVLAESRDRLNTMALIHTQLYETGNVSEMNMKVFVNGLLRQMLSSHPVQETRITPVVHVDEYLLSISIAVHLGLIINELLINALKYAFVNRKAGKIEVDFRVSEKGVVNLIVSDDGIGLPEGFDINASKTLGLRLVKTLVEDQLGGNLNIISKDGTTFKIEFKLYDNMT
jgi:PAS domain S-box-containing protein